MSQNTMGYGGGLEPLPTVGNADVQQARGTLEREMMPPKSPVSTAPYSGVHQVRFWFLPRQKVGWILVSELLPSPLFLACLHRAGHDLALSLQLKHC